MKFQNACVLCLVLMFAACNSNKSNQALEDSVTTTTDSVNTITSSPMLDPDPTDSIPADGYNASGADVQIADMIKKSLVKNILKKDLDLIPDEERKFKYEAIDLNNDSLNEYFVSFSGIYFCGSDGCTSFLLNHDGKLITKFTVMSLPVYAEVSTTNGWRDLLVMNNGALHVMKMHNGSYPGNPSVEPAFKGNIPADAVKVLDVDKDAFPAFKF